MNIVRNESPLYIKLFFIFSAFGYVLYLILLHLPRKNIYLSLIIELIYIIFFVVIIYRKYYINEYGRPKNLKASFVFAIVFLYSPAVVLSIYIINPHQNLFIQVIGWLVSVVSGICFIRISKRTLLGTDVAHKYEEKNVSR